ncbi:MAG: AMP-binding protein [Solirubrobacteraceae bacterium]
MRLADSEISGWIAEWSRRRPDKLVLRFEDRETSYGAMERRVARLAGALAGAGIDDGDRVAYLGGNAPELLDLLFACARVGAILVPLSARMPAPELEVVLANTEPEAVVAEAAFAETASAAGSSLGLRVIAFGHEDGAGSLPALLAQAPELRHDPDRDTRARHGRDRDAAARVRTGRDAGADREPQITLAIATPAMTKALISDPGWETTDLSSLRCVITGSTTVREDVLAPWFERGVRVLQDYGLTEAMPVVTIVSLDDAHRLRATAGRPLPHCSVRIAAEDGSPVESGEVGEVLVKGPTVMPEYWRNAEATRKAFHEGGWLRTGDAGVIDAEGILSIASSRSSSSAATTCIPPTSSRCWQTVRVSRNSP